MPGENHWGERNEVGEGGFRVETIPGANWRGKSREAKDEDVFTEWLE